MDQKDTTPAANSLIHLLKSALTAAGAQAFGHLTLYTSFGVIKGRIGYAFAQELLNPQNGVSPYEVIELNDVTIEHYSNHLPSATFDRLYVRLVDIKGLAFVGLQGQN